MMVKLTHLCDDPLREVVYVYGEIDGEIRFEDIIVSIPDGYEKSIEAFKKRAAKLMESCGVSEMLWYGIKGGVPFKIFKTEILND